MKVETREITITKEMYIADDGTEFHNEDACKQYEFDLLESKLALYNESYDKSTLEACTYAKLSTYVDVENMHKACEYSGITSEGIRGPGIYMYTNQFANPDFWVNITEAVAAINGGTTNDQT
jgi:hypothetical protein